MESKISNENKRVFVAILLGIFVIGVLGFFLTSCSPNIQKGDIVEARKDLTLRDPFSNTPMEIICNAYEGQHFVVTNIASAAGSVWVSVEDPYDESCYGSKSPEMFKLVE